MIGLIVNNPYRVVDLLPTATARTIQRQKQKLNTFLKVGKDVTVVYKFSFLPEIERSEESVKEAFSLIEQNQNKLLYSLFWFIECNQFDEMVLSYLSHNNIAKAIELLDKLVINKKINKQNIGAYLNYSSYLLAVAKNNDEIKKAISLKLSLINSEIFCDLVYRVVDETYIFNVNNIKELFVNSVISELESKYNIDEIINVFSGFNDHYIRKYLVERFSSRAITKIESLIEETDKVLNLSQVRDNGYDLGMALYQNTQKEVELLSTLFKSTDIKYWTTIDQLARQLMRCAVDQSNTDDSDESYNKALDLLELAEGMAVSSDILQDIKRNQDQIEENKNLSPALSEIISAAALISDFKSKIDSKNISIADINVFLASVRPLLLNLKLQLPSSDQYYVNISDAVVDSVLQALILIVNSSQDNFVKRVESESNKEALASQLTSVLVSAINISKSLSPLDMRPDLRDYYNKTHQDLENVSNSVLSSLNSRGNQSSGGLSTLIEKLIGFIIILVVISVLSQCR